MIKGQISSDFATLHTKMAVGEARAMLAGGYGVVRDESGRFITILQSEDLATFTDEQPLAELLGQLPPGIVVAAAETMDKFVQSPAFAAFAIGARGAVVYDEDEQPVGILTDETITRYLEDEFETVGEIKGFPSDTSLAGTITGTITDNPLVMYCDEFQHRNELKYYNRHKPPECQVKEPHQHPIRKKAK